MMTRNLRLMFMQSSLSSSDALGPSRLTTLIQPAATWRLDMMKSMKKSERLRGSAGERTKRNCSARCVKSRGRNRGEERRKGSSRPGIGMIEDP